MFKKIVKGISSKLTLLVTLPCLLLGGVVFYDVSVSINRMQDAYDAEYNAFLSHAILSVVHETQKERGASAGFLGSKGAKFGQTLQSQRNKTNQALDKLKTAVKDWDLSKEMHQDYQAFVAMFNQMEGVRRQVSGQSISLSQTLSYYTGINTAGLNIVLKAAKLSKNQLISQELFAVYSFSSAKESAGIERAVLANVIAMDAFTPALRSRHVELVTKQSMYLKEAIGAAPEDIYSILQQALNSNSMREVESYRSAVSNKDAGFNLDAQKWFSAATKRIEELKHAEEQALTLIDETAKEIQVQAVRFLAIEFAIVVIGFLITLALFISIQMRARQSKLIAEGMDEAIQNRDLAHNIHIVSQDDLGKSAEDINTLTKQFGQDLGEFSAMSKTIDKATHESSLAIEQGKVNLVSQQHSIQSITESSRALSSSIQEISEAMQDSLIAAQSVSQECTSGQSVVSQAMHEIEEAARDMEQSVQSVEQLNERVGGISEMVDMIRSIAEQTNLLALNAAIEAARAGEQGRGFAVVADEVRNLAGRTQQSTEEIATLVEELQASSKQASEVINNSKTSTIEAAHKAGDINQALNNIVEQAQRVEQVTESVSERTINQNSAIQEISDSLTVIYEKAVENVTSAEQLAIAAQGITSQAKTMDQLVERYKLPQ